nr:hypothetical protein [Tanacetum cinerariifolium]
SAPGSNVGDRFSLASAFPTSIEDLAEARALPDQRNEPASDDVGWTTTDSAVLVSPRIQESSSENTTDPSPAARTTDRAQTK